MRDEYEEQQPSREELAQIRLATFEEVAAVDALIFGKCTDRWRKVAMVIGSSLKAFDAQFPNLPYIIMQLRLRELVEQGRLEVQGNPMAMRHSEVRLPAGPQVTPNPSINRTSTSRLRRLAAAGYVKR